MSKKKNKDKLKKAIKKQRNLRLVSSNASPIVKFTPAMSGIDAPEGFRAVTHNQAFQEFSTPIMERFDSEDVDILNCGLQLSMLVWNYTIAHEKNWSESKELEKKMNEALCSGIGLNNGEAKTFLNAMLERKKYLFPPEIQPQMANIMYIRKEVSYLIRPFDYSNVDISNSPAIVPAEEDIQLTEKIRQMDRNIINKVPYESWEKFCMDMEQDCGKRFNVWLNRKGINEELARNFTFNIEPFLTFVYRYMHADEDIVLLESVPEEYLEDFIFDYILRKVMVKPHEYVLFMPTLKLFYKFLAEIKYIENTDETLEMLDSMEEEFIEELQERYS
ncbi:MAG: hypothetical protein WCQ99_11660 [Pseudomonadota bacterium]